MEQQDEQVDTTDDVVIDLTDGAMEKRALYDQILSTGITGELIIDLRDEALVAGRKPVPKPDPYRSGRPADLLEGLRLELIHDQSSPEWEKAERFVYDNYLDLGFCKASPRNRVEELQSWCDRSTLHVVFDHEDHVVGTSRRIVGDYADLPIGLFPRTDHRDPDPIQEFSSLVVLPTVRGMSVVAYLCRSVFFHAMAEGANALVFLLEEPLIRLLADHYALPMRYYGDTHRHMGGDVTPSGFSLVGPDYIETARVNPHYWRWMLEHCTAEQIVEWQLPIVLVDEPETADSVSVSD